MRNKNFLKLKFFLTLETFVKKKKNFYTRYLQTTILTIRQITSRDAQMN